MKRILLLSVAVLSGACAWTQIVPKPRPPFVSCSANPTTIAIGDRSTITMTATDPQGWPLSYKWSATGGKLSGSGTSTTLAATSADAGDTITVTGTATNDHDLSDSCTALVSVLPVPHKQ